MADFTGNDINDAKRRVEEMRRRSQSFVENENNGKDKNADEINHKKENGHKSENPDDGGGILGSLFSSLGLSKSDDSSSTLILALILILSKEGADNKLILALLYILL